MENNKKKEKPAKYNEKLAINGTFDDVLKAFSLAAKNKTKQKVSVLQKS